MEYFSRLCCIALLLGSHPLFASGLKTDEEILYFPTNASWGEERNTWQIPIHGWIFEAEHDSLWRQGAMALLKKQLGLAPQSNDSQHLKARGWPFLVDNERRKKIRVELEGKSFSLPLSEANGHFFGEVSLAGEAGHDTAPTRWLHFNTVMPEGDGRAFNGAVQLIAAKGLSVISDIDDTIKLSNVLDKEALLENTFLRDFQAIPGMADHYREWEAQGAAFHYVTASPWQLYPALKDFITSEGFPQGSFAMRHFRLKDSSLLAFLSSSQDYKTATIDALLFRYPQRRFVLVGDSGEKDPEVYAEIARRYPEQVAAIYIRNVTGETQSSPRFAAAFSGVPPERLQLFDDARDIRLSPPSLAATTSP